MLDPISLSLGGVAGSETNTGVAQKSLQETYTQFLTLLTTQLKNQDPLNPMDSKDFTNQLIQLASAEQQIAQTEKMGQLLEVNQATAVNMALNYIGKEVDYVGGDMRYSGSPVNIKYFIEGDAQRTKISVSDENGKVVFSTDGEKKAGSHAYVWDGKDNDGNPVAEGQYKVAIGAQDADGKAVQTYAIVPAIVNSVETAGGQVLLVINGQQVSIGSVQAVRMPTPAANQAPDNGTDPENTDPNNDPESNTSEDV